MASCGEGVGAGGTVQRGWFGHLSWREGSLPRARRGRPGRARIAVVVLGVRGRAVRPVLDWTDRGRELAASLNACHAVVVAGTDAVATAEVALGIAREEATHRRVAVADLFGDAPPLQGLVARDDPHGIVDSFVFGVSLNKVAHAVANAGELFGMPSGSSPIDHEELLPNPRWRRLSGGFREVGALLLLVVPADAPRLRDLVDTTDGIVIVRDVAPPDVPVAQALAWLRPRRPSSAAPR